MTCSHTPLYFVSSNGTIHCEGNGEWSSSYRVVWIMSELEQQKAGQRFSTQMRRNVDFTASSTVFLGGVICGRTTVEHEMNASIDLETSQPFAGLLCFTL